MSIEDRVNALEAQLREQAALRAQQDGDLSGLTQGLRAANNLLQALALTQSDQTAVLAEHTTTLAGLTRRMGEVDAGVKTIIEMLGTVIRNQGGQDSPS